jgi:hypothetical protein
MSRLGAVARHVSPRVRTHRPRVILPPKPRVTVPHRSRERSSGEPPMVPLGRFYDVSHPLVDGGSGLDRRYPFFLIKSKPSELKSIAEIDLLFHGLMSRNHGSSSWDRGPIHEIFCRKII